ncbi:cardiolipin synthetase [Hartmannibacter diazotrophicus]|uniref:Phospholipase D n=1 Tax=Hartmannibacter diazotrophicus TaxID=1482074 RepID=A0A2C9D7G8_9HYPH|nr:VTT domain-containing protein [Hartmannibacter diazotrophicus]SON55691.1 cardiolipin synthetase [Hartmannibacter diazotrophicus]
MNEDAHYETTAAGSLLQPGRNIWTKARADRAGVLVDAANYYGALRQAMLNAKRTIHIAGWDIDSRMRLVGPSNEADDGLPETFADFLTALVRRNRRLRIRILLWDYSMVFSLERELVPVYSLLWNTPPQIEFCLDDACPVGGSHHQKIVVVDDSVAFCGGIDITRRRWDVPNHAADDSRRVDPNGERYAPFHDVQMVVDGEIASSLGDIFRRRWERATCEPLRKPKKTGLLASWKCQDPWPSAAGIDLEDVEIGLARTEPRYGQNSAVREVEALYCDMIDVAETFIYIENQFLTSELVAHRMVERLKARPDMHVVAVTPKSYPGWITQEAMEGGRSRFMRIVADHGVGDRVHVVYPDVTDDGETKPVFVHAKVMIVDDRILRIGSSNLCNRSMGLDTECDLVVVAGNEAQEAAIRQTRYRLLGEHLGLEPKELEAHAEEAGTFKALMEARTQSRRTLKTVEPPEGSFILPIEAIADPSEPPDRPLSANGEKSSLPKMRHFLWGTVAVCGVLLLMFVWNQLPQAQPDQFTKILASIEDQPFAPAIVLLAFLAGGLVAFPLTVMMLATIAVFGVWPGVFLAASGALASAILTYFVGRGLGTKLLRRYVGPRINRVRRALARSGILAVATIRLIPIAPFTVINLVSGAVGIRFVDYVLGSILGLMPGILVMTVLGNQIVEIFRDPSLANLSAVGAIFALWLFFSLGLQALVRRYRGSSQ